MSHELRTPLNAIIGFSETMLEFPIMYDNIPLPDSYNADMAQIYSSGRQLLHVINDILDLAKVDAGKLDVELARVNPEPIVLATVSTAKGLVGSKPIELEKDLPQPIPEVWVDETRLRQVLLNLYSNAVKFTEKGVIKLSVREVNEGVQFSLQDTGCGIAAEDMELIFQEFKQASPGGRDVRAGSGLGLTISRQLLDLMDGRIWVESELGKGSTFHFIVQKYNGQDGNAVPETPSTPAATPDVPPQAELATPTDATKNNGLAVSVAKEEEA
jgi:signal transduction histidine kinase